MHRRLLSLLLALSLALPGAALASGGGKAKKGDEGPIVDVAPVSVSVRRPNGRWAVITIEADLNVPAEPLRQKAQLSVPRLRAAYTEVLARYAHSTTSEKAVNLDLIAGQLQKATDTVLGGRGAQVMLGGVILQ
ncbi:hypothetical protein P7B02_06140 [Caulobacter segnis]|uniref:hypothetical protein n=1 Tax=Caulobacter segnis TaxID=88688 RepID=UPI00240EF6FC|nr:hypothetical protein [Caulobacter segnis]MDG2521118.1 hypothetical protein [Caulobacter segnis]